MHTEQSRADHTADQQSVTKQFLKTQLLTHERYGDHRAQHKGRGQRGGQSLVSNIVVHRGVHIHTDILGQILHGADADTVDAQSHKSTVLLHDFENVGDLDIVRLGFLVNNHTLLGQRIVQQAGNKAEHGASDTGDHVTGRGIFTEQTNDNGADHAGNGIAEHGTDTTGGGQGRTLGVVGGHGAQQGAHGDIEHGVGCFVQDLEREQSNQQGDAVQEGGDCPHSDGGYSQQRRCPQQPGTELTALILSSCESLVHQRTHHGIVDRIPDGPDDGQNKHYFRIDAQYIGAVDGENAGHQSEGHTAAPVAEHVTKPMLGCQAAGSFRIICHFYCSSLYFCGTETLPHSDIFILTNYER